MAIGYSKHLYDQITNYLLQQNFTGPQLLSLLQVPKQQKDHINVANWQAPAQNNGDSPDGAGDGSRGTDKGYTFTVGSFTTRLTALEEPKPKPPAIPHAGIRTGEIIGHRIWVVTPDMYLGSVAHVFPWQPGMVIHGDVEQQLYHCCETIMGGVYSFQSLALLYSEFYEFIRYASADAASIHLCVAGYPKVIGIARGTIKMWGEVVEHDYGYRAEYARVRSIDEVYGGMDRREILAELNERYGL